MAKNAEAPDGTLSLDRALMLGHEKAEAGMPISHRFQARGGRG